MSPWVQRLVCSVLVLNAFLMWAIADRYATLRDAQREIGLVVEANLRLEARRTERISWPSDTLRR
jgi:hypothetical protein